MSLQPSEEIGMEKHENTTQFIRVEKGDGVAIIENNRVKLCDGTAIIIQPNKNHNIINTSKNTELKLYTIYIPPEHKPDTLEHTKQ
jgi:mannose-6-phosphate isomerase-like protein (cupin superfamily)